ncbi:MAG: hypothetical protein CR984_04105 [Proteobacteria bacterium]|nr:MAG: hypothetical protein CR984_04105 [Pseudomonadota bacterium]PIE66841.1 MAG: hypothetical protein CSA23_07155 [Deltaproteobacteria bacterium]
MVVDGSEICVAPKMLSSEYQPYASGNIFGGLDLKQICLFPDGCRFYGLDTAKGKKFKIF